MSNGKDDAKNVIQLVDDEKGWASFRPVEGQPDDVELSQILAESVSEWIRDNPGLQVISTVGIASEGRTVGINLWYREE